MNVTELLVTGYDDGKSVFAINITLDMVAAVKICPNVLDEAETEEVRTASVPERAAHVLNAVDELVRTMLPVG